jgi:acyl carrier protein phosphodiesterase
VATSLGWTSVPAHPELQRGITQHRAIDQFVDAHPIVRASRARQRPALG